MTPQEQQLVADLFDRLASLEGQRRDPDAERLIREGLGRSPNAVYTLVQSVLVQDEALKRANARIEELEHAAAPEPAPRGSVPSVRPGGQGSSGVWGNQPPAGPSYQQQGYPQQGYPQQPGYPPQAGPMGGAFGGGMPGAGGGSFLGTAAAAAAGVVGGGLLLNSIRGMMGGTGHQAFAGDSERLSSPSQASPWSSNTNDPLSRDAGVGDIGSSNRNAAFDDPSVAAQNRADDAAQDAEDDQDVGSFDDDYGNDSDVA